MTRDVQKIGATVRDAAKEKLDQLEERASEYFEQGRDDVNDVARACERFLRQRPLTSLLLAAGVGLLFGRFWLRR